MEQQFAQERLRLPSSSSIAYSYYFNAEALADIQNQLFRLQDFLLGLMGINDVAVHQPPQIVQNYHLAAGPKSWVHSQDVLLS